MQRVIVAILVLAALVYLINRFRKNDHDCDNCNH